MIATVARFELLRRLRLRSTIVYALLLFGLGALVMSAAGGAFDSISASTGEGRAFANSPYAIHQLLAILPCFLVSVVANFIGDAIYQDFEHRTYAMILSTPLGKRRYLAGRLLGAFGALVVVFLALPLGLFIASKMPWLKAARIGPTPFRDYLIVYVTTSIPTLAFVSLVFFGVVTIARRIGPVHVSAVVMLFGWLISGKVTDGVHDRTLAALIDPFCLKPLEQASEYFTVLERNTRLIPFTGLALLNRVVWLAAAGLLALYGARRFRPALEEARAKRQRKETPPSLAPRTVTLDRSLGAYLRVGPRLVLSAARGVLATRQIRVLLFLAFVLLVFTARSAGEIFGTRTWPVTYQLLELTGGTVSLVAIAIASLAAAELVFRDRQYGMQSIVDATPAPSWLLFSSQLCTMLAVLVVLGLTAVLAGVAIQLGSGYHRLELALYWKTIFGLMLPEWIVFGLLALAIHSLSPNRHIGHLVTVGVYVAQILLPQLGVHHNLLRFGSTPSYTYSDMNRFGPFVSPALWFRAYWLAWACTLALLGLWLWRRGEDERLSARWRRARARGLPWPALVAAGIALALGGFIYRATNILNRYASPTDVERHRADYERTYRPFLDTPQPRVRAVEIAADIYPRERRIVTHGTYKLENASGAPIAKIMIELDDEAKVETLALDRSSTDAVGARFGVHVLTLATPLQAGESATLRFDFVQQQRAFRDEEEPTAVAANGTFIQGQLPSIGYNEDEELSLDDVRARHGLGPRHHLPDPSDPRARLHNYVSQDADWIDFGATVSTDEDQTALAPGELKKTWIENGRRYFRYEPGRKILNFVSFLSARYVVDHGHAAGVDIEVYRDPAHAYNGARMIEAAGKALAAYDKRFSPYPYKTLRIAEFPRYATFAQSFPTLIPYSEGIGFIARVDHDDPDDIDYPFYITAHEVAHQWWAHRLIAGRAKGETLLSETLAEYSALTLLRDEVGRDHMARFLRYEQRGYLSGRTFDRLGEKPLSLAENQTYIHYNKGSLATYLLAELAGQDAIDGVLRGLLDRYSDKGPPYPVSTDLTDALRAKLPALKDLITDLFDRIVLFDLRATSATARPLPNGRWEVTLGVSVRKILVDDQGAEHEVPIAEERDEDIDVGALGEGDAVLHVERKHLKPGASTVTFIVDKKPLRAGIDPLYLRIDRKLEDNLTNVKLP